ncbi:MAG: FkbM family methyltransferase [Selenomonadaceae bacterium]|nr:FkbM family methyltransferase [Selenomonadaceae bacterium]
MKNFVKLIKQVHEERIAVVSSNLIRQKTPVAFLSLSSVAKAVESVKILRAQKLNVTNLIVLDNAPPTGNLDFAVVHMSNAAKIFPQPEYIFTADDIDTRFTLKNFPASKVITLSRGNTEHIYEMFMTHLPELQEVYESLIDEESRKTFCGYWLGNISCQLAKIVHSNEAHYLISGFIPKPGAVTIDCGVFDGGTATVFAEMGYKVYGFEIDKLNYEHSLKVAEEKNFVLENLGLGSYKHTARYNLTGSSGSKLLTGGAQSVEVTTIDAYAREHNLPSVDFIKMDVEGAELDILRGAKTSIARFKPILALSAYHKWDDFWTLMNFIKSIRSDYEFALRHSYETPEEEPANFSKPFIENLIQLGLEVDRRTFYECVLFAR